MDQSVSLNRETIIKESDVYIGYHSVEKKILLFIIAASSNLASIYLLEVFIFALSSV